MDKDESTPPIDPILSLTSTSTKPKRTKTTHACDHCKRKKVKCNGEHPCVRCQKLGVPCTFTPHQSKWDSSAPYAITQAQRLSALEKALDSLQVDSPVQDTINSPSFNNDNDNNSTPSVTMTSPLEKFNTSSTGKPYYADDWETRLDRLPTAMHMTTTLSEHTAKIPNDSALLKNLTIHFDLLSIYFDQVHHYFPILHQESFCCDLDKTSPLLLNAMYAIATQWSGTVASTQKQQLSSQTTPASCSLKYYQDAIALVELYLDAPRLSTIQALLLIIKYQELVRRHGFFSRTRFYLGMVVRMCNDLGLSQVLPPTCQVPPTLMEERRRVFWVAYIYDLLISTELGAQPRFPVDRCIVEFPGLLDDEKNNKKRHDTVLYLHWMARVVKTQGMVLHYLRQKYEDQSQQQQQHLKTRLHSIIQYMKELGAELATWKEHGGERFEFVFLAYHFTNILLYRSLFLDLQYKNAGDRTINKIGIGAVAGHDAVKTLLLQEANAIVKIVDGFLCIGVGASRLHHGFRGGQQLIHYLTAVRTVLLMYRQEDDKHVKDLIYHLTKLTPAMELYSMDQQRTSRLDAGIAAVESRNQHCSNRMNEYMMNQPRSPAPSSSPSSTSSPPTGLSSMNGRSSSSSPSPLVNTAYIHNTIKDIPQSCAIYDDDNLSESLNDSLHNTASLTFSSCGFYQNKEEMNQNWAQQLQQNGSSLASTSKYNSNLTLDTSALPLLYQPSSSSDISPMIPTPLSLNVVDSTTIASTHSSTIRPAIRACRSHQQLRKTTPLQWVSSTAALEHPDLLSPTYSRSATQHPSSTATPSQRMHAIASRPSSPSTSSLPSSPLHRMTLSDDPAPWVQSTPSVVLPSYPQQQIQQLPASPSYVQPYGIPLPPPEDQHQVIYDDTLLGNNVLPASSIALPPPVDEPMNELVVPTTLTWNQF